MTRFLTRVPFPYAEADARNWIESLQDRVPTERAFVVARDGEGVIGAIGLKSELGYWFAEPYWGQGYATEAASAALEWYFDATNAKSITSGAHEDNPASLNVQRKLGFVVIGSKSAFSVSRNAEVRIVKTLLTRSTFTPRGTLS